MKQSQPWKSNPARCKAGLLRTSVLARRRAQGLALVCVVLQQGAVHYFAICCQQGTTHM